jgi:hypothetical protein
VPITILADPRFSDLRYHVLVKETLNWGGMDFSDVAETCWICGFERPAGCHGIFQALH